ncbi:MAG: glycosyltransferase family 2 protein [Candidatus Eremiobacteraeota bacterium]|nr:glycosyltransferase family 2 protein [Candidatus Eremiobacteraeota bacterium]
MEKISLVIPVFNEAENLNYLLPQIPRFIDETIVVDSWSEDKTVEVAQSHGVKIVFAKRGKGAALRAGMKEASGDIVITMDGDCSQLLDDLSRFAAAVQSGNHIVIGSRFLKGGGSEEITPFRKSGIFLFRTMINSLWKTNFTDVNYGYRAFKKEVIPLLELTADGFDLDVELVIHAAKKKIKILEIPCYEKKRAYGKAKLGAIKDGWLLFFRILRELFCSVE